MAFLVIGIVLILLFFAGLFGDPPSMTSYLFGGGALFLLPGALCIAFGVRRMQRRRVEAMSPTQPAASEQVRPGAALAQATSPTAGVPASGWFTDPEGRHQQRFWDGARWTHHVADDGTSSIEAPGVEELLRILSEGSDVPGQISAARMLGGLGDFRGVRPLVDVAITRTQVPELREAALAALADIGHPSAAEPLVAAAVSGAFGGHISALGRTLAVVGDTAVLAPLLVKVLSSNAEFDDYQDPFEYESEEIHIQTEREVQEGISDDCAFILGSAGDKGAEGLLAAVVLGKSRLAVSLALGRMADPPVERLAALAHADDPGARWAAIEALGEAACRGGGSQRDMILGLLRGAAEDDDEGVREAARRQLQSVGTTETEVETPQPASLLNDDHDVRKEAVTRLKASGLRDPVEPQAGRARTDPSTWDANRVDRELRDHPHVDVAYMRAAYPTGRSEDHEHADPGWLREGVDHCRRRGYLLARLSSYSTWQGDELAALDYAVASVLVGDPSQGPGDMVQVLELLALSFRKAKLFSDAVTAAEVQASYSLGPTEAAAVERAAAALADRHADEVGWAAGIVRERLAAVLAEKRRLPLGGR